MTAAQYVQAHRDGAVVLGAVFLTVGAWILHQAYDAAGEPRPFVLRLLPAS